MNGQWHGNYLLYLIFLVVDPCVFELDDKFDLEPEVLESRFFGVREVPLEAVDRTEWLSALFLVLGEAKDRRELPP